MIKALIKFIFKNKVCNNCIYYHNTNNTCQLKKVSSCGNHPYISLYDMIFCTASKIKKENNDK